MNINFLAIFVASLVTFPIGFTWYHPKVMGNAWMKEIGATQESMSKDFNMTKTMILSFLCSFFTWRLSGLPSRGSAASRLTSA